MANAGERIMGTVSGFQAASILVAACELDLFTRLLRAGAMTVAELAQASACNPRGMTALTGALVSLEFLTADAKGKLTVPPEMAPLLDSESPESLIPIIRHYATCQRHWSQLSHTVKTGFPFPRQSSFLGPLEDYRSFILGMNSIARQVVGPMTEKMKQAGLLHFRRMLDLGGASGTYTFAFLAANPDGIATIFDLPIVVEEARIKTAQSPFADRISFAAGDFERDELPDGFDFIWVSAIIHSQPPEEVGRLLAKSYRGLEPGGRIAIRDVYVRPDRNGPPAATLFGVNMLTNTVAGQVYTEDEVFTLLKSAGFQNPRTAIPAEDMGAVIVAEK